MGGKGLIPVSAAAERALPFGLALLAALSVAALTWRWGLGVWNDGATYLSAADSIARGGGFGRFNGQPYAAWPPLYPLSMAPWIALGATPIAAARLVNAVAFGVTVGFSTATLRRLTGSTGWALAGGALLLLNVDLVRVYCGVWSEAMMTAGGAAALWVMTRRPAAGTAAGLGAVIGLTLLTRFVGAAWLLPGACWLAIGGARLDGATTQPSSPLSASRLRRVGTFLAVALSGQIAWIVWNTLATGMPVGKREPTPVGLGENLATFLDALGSALALPSNPARAWLGGLFLLMVVGLAGSFGRLRPVAGFLVLYVSLVVGLASMTMVQVLSGRFVTPALVPALVIAVAALACTELRGGRTVDWARAGMGLWLFIEILQFVPFAQGAYTRGLGGFGDKAWHRSAVIKALTSADAKGDFISNASPAVWLYTGLPAHAAPQWHPWGRPLVDLDPTQTLRQDLADQAGSELHLVWFARADEVERYASPTDLRAAGFVLDTVWEGGDGGIYRVGAR